ncbi:MAG: FtsK/SpoIIIE domain-containing protein [Planctomycetaceae bacterium]
MSDTTRPSDTSLTVITERLLRLEADIAQRTQSEQAFVSQFGSSIDPELEALEQKLSDVVNRQSVQAAELQEQFASRRREIESEHLSQRNTVKSEHEAELSRVRREAQQETDRVNAQHEDSRWVATSVLDETADESPKRQFERVRQSLDKSLEQQQSQIASLQTQLHEIAESRGWSVDPLGPPETDANDLESFSTEFSEATEAAHNRLTAFQKLRLPKLFVGLRSLWLFVVLTAVIGIPVFLFVPPSIGDIAKERMDPAWMIATFVASAVASALLVTVMYTLASMSQSDAFARLHEQVSAAQFFHERWSQLAIKERQRREREYEKQQLQREEQLRLQLERFEATHQRTLAEIDERRQAEISKFSTEYTSRTKAIDAERVTQLAAIDEEEKEQLAELKRSFEDERNRSQMDLDLHIGNRRLEQERAWAQLTSTWTGNLQAFDAYVNQSRQRDAERNLTWSQLAGPEWTPPTVIPEGIRIGEYEIDLAQLPHGMPELDGLTKAPATFRIPTILPFPEKPSLLLETKGKNGRREAVEAMQVVLLRMLTRLPPGKLRLTIIDPVGLGESFAGLMHLGDFDELLITSRIWTEMGHIESRLAELTEHMENVLQKYLRNEFATIEEYNHFAGEVAEPYHVLVVADFPHKFSEQAAKRLVSIATSGPRCGVYLLMSTDTSAQMPNAFDLPTVEETANTFEWRTAPRTQASVAGQTPAEESAPQHRDFDDSSFSQLGLPDDFSSFGKTTEDHREPAFYLATDQPLLARWPVVIDTPPPPDLFTKIVKNVGEASKDVRRVEVSFSRIAPKPEEFWSKDSRSGIDIPLGRAGATKLQHLRLGKGTSQHMLVAGKTGSGKSTFFHTLITNVAMYYSAEEVDFYLVDFKKGVEFKAYAGGKLPHARVIAIESDREFGVSVLHRLDAVMNQRGDLFRKHNVQDIAGYRNLVERQEASAKPLPRILLVIDEFQEFFVEDDRYSQQAALMLDRLVRQGRAFGVHVILGSQTLGGAYSLARSTLGQVAVRVALQCSEADAHLILSEDNTAARLLTRPGEAIYNDANGMIEGNHPFQIAWLPDEEREGYLGVMQHFAREQHLKLEPAVVFEGNIPSDVSRNEEFVELLSAGWPGLDQREAPEQQTASAPHIWLGEAVEIGPPTSINFPQQAGTNLILIGSDPDAALGILSTGLIALAAQQSPPATSGGSETEAAPFYVFDGNPVGSPEANLWKHVAGVIPSDVHIITPPHAPQALAELSAERLRRDADPNASHPPLFVIIDGVSKFRDLRKSDDDFSLSGFGSSSDDAPADPGQQFTDLLSKGPDLGMHVLLWADTYSNADRWLSRQSMREFELRIAFTMNAADSSNFLDSPLASRLGVHRGLLYREETGTLTKFRPYGPPTPQWLDHIRSQLQAEQELEPATDLDSFRVS